MTGMVPVAPKLADGTLRVGDSIWRSREEGLLSLLGPGQSGIVSVISGDGINVFWLDTKESQPVGERELSRLWHSRHRANNDELMQWWLAETRVMSSTEDIMHHPVAGMFGGIKAVWWVDRLIDTLGKEDVQTLGILEILHRLTGKQPFPDDQRGDVPAMIQAWRDWRFNARHKHAKLRKICEEDFIGAKGTCRDCGSPVSHYTCNGPLIAKRPMAAEWDWWGACDNLRCQNRIGEGIFQNRPDFEIRGTTPNT